MPGVHIQGLQVGSPVASSALLFKPEICVAGPTAHARDSISQKRLTFSKYNNLLHFSLLFLSTYLRSLCVAFLTSAHSWLLSLGGASVQKTPSRSHRGHGIIMIHDALRGLEGQKVSLIH